MRFVPPQWMHDTDLLAAMMHGSNYLNGGGNHDVWRIDGVTGADRHILRVSKHYQNAFLDVLHPPRIEGCEVAAMDARAAQSLAAFFDAEGNQVADIQPEMNGMLLGLTNAERASRSDKITYALTEADFWGRPVGSPSVRYEPNAEKTAATNVRLWALAERIVAMPLSFFVQTMKDVREIEDHGYTIDPSKATNFTLMAQEDRVGFVDLMRSDFKRHLAPCELATVLVQPANQTWWSGSTKVDENRRTRLADTIRARMIAACDHLGLAYTYHESAANDEQRLRNEFSLQRPHMVRSIQKSDRGMPMGHGLNAGDIKVPAPQKGDANGPSRCGLRL